MTEVAAVHGGGGGGGKKKEKSGPTVRQTLAHGTADSVLVAVHTVHFVVHPESNGCRKKEK